MKDLYLHPVKLKRLDIKGFKSFANDTSIHFNDEIIGIVGPNGSGKSNIVDAIRWVLGEQKSRELRLEKMVDVIFNGTKSKRKASMAQVSMTFENSRRLIPLEYENVTISRILYDTNDSEYRLNDVPCRLKDIRDLFLDTGIGSNSYAIIELGMVDDILMDKDHARRRMFEQAAGISKYKIRKRETMNKLKNTQNDLDRIEDILFELQSNLKSLEKQAKRTRKYYELKTEYKHLSIQSTVINQKQAIEDEARLKKDLEGARDQFNALNAKVHELEAGIESMKHDNLAGEKKLNEEQKGFNTLIDELRKTESQIEIKKQNINFLGQNIKRVEHNKLEFSVSQKNADETLNKMFKELEALKSGSEAIKKRYLDWKEQFESIERLRVELQGESNSKLEELKILENRKFEKEKQLVELKSNLNNKLNNKSSLEAEMASSESNSVELQKIHAELQASVDKELQALKSLQFSLENSEQEKRKIQENIEELRDKLVLANRSLDAMSNEYTLLKDMIDNLEGFPESAKFLVKKWDKAKPVLSDILECEEEYRGAIEAYLDPYLSYFILDNVEEARASISLLRQAQKGKAQFFILSGFDTNKHLTVNLSQYGKAAVNVVKTDDKYAPLLHHLLSKVVIVDEESLLHSELPDDELIYLSKSGSANRTKHVISGGSIGLFDGKRIGRQKEIKKLKTRIEKTRDEVANLESRLKEQRERLASMDVEELIGEIQKKSSVINQMELRKVEIETKIQNAASARDSIQSKFQEIENALSRDEELMKEIGIQLNSLEQDVRQKNKAVEDQSGKIESISQDYSRINSNYNEAQLEWVKHQNQIESIENEIRFRTQQLNEFSSKLTMAEEELVKLAADVENNKKELKALEEQLYVQSARKSERQEQLTEAERQFFSFRSDINKKEDELRQLNKNIQNQQLIINEIKDALTGIEFELRSALERLKIEFNIEASELKAEIPETAEEIEELHARHEKIKRRLENYGEINPMAVEAYDEMLERFENMESQRKDILDARNSLNATIGEIDSEATRMFLDSFQKVKDNFKEVFRSLFSDEDDCDLILFNLEDPLESDIEIVAKPKGKRPKVLSQLSGGEKTLTATALLFSLYLLKPAPFCIFDEVDAPLDDINIQKFSRLIRRFSDQSQFIIITHNKSTMAAMDKLYGVYMQEQGVSGITQVDFREYEHNEMFRTVNLQ